LDTHPTHPDLTDDEIAFITRPLRQPAAQVRFLATLGVSARRRPDNTVLVNRQHYITVRSAETLEKRT
jgi:hypothetical protein